MATVYVSIGKAGHHSGPGGKQPVWTGAVQSETITSSGTAAAGNLVATDGDIAKIECETDLYATANGTASASNGVYVKAGVAQYIGLAAGQSISVIDV